MAKNSVDVSATTNNKWYANAIKLLGDGMALIWPSSSNPNNTNTSILPNQTAFEVGMGNSQYNQPFSSVITYPDGSFLISWQVNNNGSNTLLFQKYDSHGLPCNNLIGDDYDNDITGTGCGQIINGLGGDDLLTTRGGSDHLIGGLGRDTFVINPSESFFVVQIQDFEPWNGEVLDISSIVPSWYKYADIYTSESGPNTILNLSPCLIILQDIHPDNLTDSNFNFIPLGNNPPPFPTPSHETEPVCRSFDFCGINIAVYLFFSFAGLLLIGTVSYELYKCIKAAIGSCYPDSPTSVELHEAINMDDHNSLAISVVNENDVDGNIQLLGNKINPLEISDN